MRFPASKFFQKKNQISNNSVPDDVIYMEV